MLNSCLSFVLFFSVLLLVGTRPQGNVLSLQPLLASQSPTVFISCVATIEAQLYKWFSDSLISKPPGYWKRVDDRGGNLTENRFRCLLVKPERIS